MQPGRLPCRGKDQGEAVKRIVEHTRGKYKDFNDHQLAMA
jgi:hypothetical protein